MAAAATLKTQPLGEIHDYVLINEVGRGAHGVVFRGHVRAHASDLVAVKIVEDNSPIDRLLLEPQLLSKLHHPNIVRLRDYFLHAGKVVLVTEYIDGPDLAIYAERRSPLTSSDVREFLRQMADAVGYAHAAGIFHSDLKPKNILVDTSAGQPRYVIADFGVSRVASGVQRKKYIAGTCAFMAPEQLRGRGGIQSDLWAVGAISYTLLTGKPPFPGRTMEEVRRQVQFDQPVFPPNLANEDATLERTLVHLLEKNPPDRTSSAAELTHELAAKPSNGTSGGVYEMTEVVVPQWEKGLAKEVSRRKRWIIIWASISSLPEIVVQPLCYLGVWVIYLGQTRRKWPLTLVGLGVLGAALLLAFLEGFAAVAIIGKDADPILSVVSTAFGLIGLAAAMDFVKLRRAQRELTLVQSLRTGNREESLEVLRQYVSTATGDMNLRRRYIEALLATGKTAEAAVEAKLVLEIDPYNLPASLLLANAYLELGLLERCEQVCNGYLEISPQCFEFEELRQASIRRRGAT